MDSHVAEGASRQGQSAHQLVRRSAATGVEKRREDLEIHIPAGPRLGNVVIEADSVSKGYGENLLVDDMTFALPPGGIVGVIGPNGAGKTTLFRMITDQEQPDAARFAKVKRSCSLTSIRAGRSIPKKSIWEEISGGEDMLKLGAREVNSRAYVARFNFSGSDQQKKVGMLSGGERNRVHLAKMLKEGANVLLLDEPTNDLDVNTLRALEEALENFAGCAVVISHDRWFLDRIATHILAFEGDSKVVWFEGNYSDYEADRKEPRVRRRNAAPDQVPAIDAVSILAINRICRMSRDPNLDPPASGFAFSTHSSQQTVISFPATVTLIPPSLIAQSQTGHLLVFIFRLPRNELPTETKYQRSRNPTSIILRISDGAFPNSRRNASVK